MVYIKYPCSRHIMGEIADLECGTQGFRENHVLAPKEQAGTNTYSMVYQDKT